MSISLDELLWLYFVGLFYLNGVKVHLSGNLITWRIIRKSLMLWSQEFMVQPLKINAKILDKLQKTLEAHHPQLHLYWIILWFLFLHLFSRNWWLNNFLRMNYCRLNVQKRKDNWELQFFNSYLNMQKIFFSYSFLSAYIQMWMSCECLKLWDGWKVLIIIFWKRHLSNYWWFVTSDG